MAIRIEHKGLADAFYDEGRFGYQYLGVNPGGAMDVAAMQTANLLVGNPPNEAVLEMAFPSSTILFLTDALVAIAGADFTPLINNTAVPVNKPFAVAKNSLLKFQKPVWGTYAYMAVCGGYQLQQWLGSYSTHLLCNTGGFKGRALTAGDEISFETKHNYQHLLGQQTCFTLPLKANTQGLYRNNIRVIPGRNFKMLTYESREQFQQSGFTISAQSNRMGYRLQAEPLQVDNYEHQVSSGVTMGSIQLLPNGQLIVLMADHQTTGGYPVIGHIINADLPSLAQMPPGSSVRFTLTDQYTAEQALLQQHRHLLQLRNACNFRLKHYLHANG